jgi:hypothetical protein
MRSVLKSVIQPVVTGGSAGPNGAPSGLTLTVLSDTSIKLDWTAGSTNQDGHSIERSTDGVTYAEIATVLGATVTYSNTGLTAATLYYYRVRAYKGTNYSVYSNVVSARTWILFGLTSTGNGTGVSTLSVTVSATTTFTLDGANANFYTDAAGTLGASKTWAPTAGGTRTIYVKCTSGSSNMWISANTVTKINAWTSGANAASLSGDISKLTSLTYLKVTGNNTVSGSIAALTSLTYLSVGGNNTVSGSIAGLTSLTYLAVYGSNTVSGSIAGLTSLTYLAVYGSNTVSGSIAGLTS